jgi:hypothetical protein
MSRTDELPPDQRAALSLLLRQRQSYAQVAAALGMSERAVHDRAHAALAVLAPREARGLSPEQRAEVGDYLLGQQNGEAERTATRAHLATSAASRAWAHAILAELTTLTNGELPDIPPPAPAATGAPSRSGRSSAASAFGAPSLRTRAPGEHPEGAGFSRSLPSSRTGGALLLAALVIAVIVVVVLLSGGGGSSSNSKTGSNGGTTTATETSGKGPAVTKRIALAPPVAGSGSSGVVDVLAEGSKRAFYIEARKLPKTKHFFYAIWLYSSPSNATALSKAPPVGKTHRLAGGALLPANAASYKEILLTKETNPHPSVPGKVVLRGAFSLG